MPFLSFSRRPNVQQLKAEGDIEGLIEALDYKDDENVRLAAASALGQIGDERAVDPLLSALEDQARVKEVAINALGEIGDERAVEELIATLEDADWEIRGAIAKALGKISEPLTIKPLVNLLKDESDNVRWYASQALETITGESFGEDIAQWEQLVNELN